MEVTVGTKIVRLEKQLVIETVSDKKGKLLDYQCHHAPSLDDARKAIEQLRTRELGMECVSDKDENILVSSQDQLLFKSGEQIYGCFIAKDLTVGLL